MRIALLSPDAPLAVESAASEKTVNPSPTLACSTATPMGVSLACSFLAVLPHESPDSFRLALRLTRIIIGRYEHVRLQGRHVGECVADYDSGGQPFGACLNFLTHSNGLTETVPVAVSSSSPRTSIGKLDTGLGRLNLSLQNDPKPAEPPSVLSQIGRCVDRYGNGTCTSAPSMIRSVMTAWRSKEATIGMEPTMVRTSSSTRPSGSSSSSPAMAP